MKRFLSLLLVFTCLTKINAQDLTGVWTGTFYTNKIEMLYGSDNRYEVQIDNVGRGVRGVTYSYGGNGFYGKSSLVGMWTPGTKNIVFKEDNLLDYQNADKANVEMFTCFLEYRKEGDKEILEGDFTSVRYKTNIEGTGGKIYLERTTTSHFKKEPFVIKKEQADSIALEKKYMSHDMAKKIPLKKKQVDPQNQPTPPVKPKTATTNPVVKNKTTTTPTPKPKSIVSTPQKSKADVSSKPKVTPTLKPTLKEKPVTTPLTQTPSTKPANPATVTIATPPKKINPPIELPKVLKERTNELFKTIPVSSNEIDVSFYDNGEIDGDTISVYLNGKLLASHRGLTTEPITFKIKIDEDNPDQEIVMVAENLGTIPPNTALMIVKVGGKRYDVNLSSTEQKNAMVKFRYQKE